MIATNALTLAFEVLREPCSKKKKPLIMKVNGQRKDSTHFVLTVGTKIPKTAIGDWEQPDLECEVEVLDDYTDEDEDDTRVPARSKRGRDEKDEESDGDGRETRKMLKSKAGYKGKGKDKVEVGMDSDDEAFNAYGE